VPLLKESIRKAYGKKGDRVVAMNYAAVDAALERLAPIDIPAGWGREEVGRAGFDAGSSVGRGVKRGPCHAPDQVYLHKY
jgi:pyruvate-ferredoxin/flavodoxin oxidoreductase